MNLSSVRAVSLVIAVALAGTPAVRAAFPTVYLKPVCLKQIYSPTTITHAPDGSGRVFICDQLGKIYIFQNGMLLPTPFLNIASTGNTPPNNGPGPVVTVTTGYSERGLLGLAFHPGYANPLSPGYRKFYINYSKNYVPGSPDFDPPPPSADHSPTFVTVISEFQVSMGNPNAADPLSERRLLRFTQPQSNHNGGQLEFGPETGPNGERYLYIGVGDGGSQMDNNVGHTGGSGARPTDNLGNSQDKTRYHGKILRIDPLATDGPGGQYGIPASNPFFNDATAGLKKEIYAYGMRNPWRFSFDKRAGGTNRLFCGDVGGDRTEEVDIVVSGGNYGWRYKEGLEFPLFSSNAANAVPPGPNMTLPPAEVAAMVDPIAIYAHPGQTVGSPALPQLGSSITGGFIYRGAAIPALQGKYIFGDYGAVASLTNGRVLGLEETSPLSGVFTLTEAVPLVHTASSPNIPANNNSNPIVGQRILSLGEDEAGEIYVALKSTQGVLQTDGGLPAGGIYKIMPMTEGTLAVNPAKDTSIFSEYVNNSSGQGINMFAGVTNTGYPRRALMAFDVSALPAGAIVSSAQVQLSVSLGQGSNVPMALHRVTQSWGEGTSNSGETGGTGVPAQPGDATWNARFYSATTPTLWTTPGGDYAATASATTLVSAYTSYTWTSAQLAADAQGWVADPTTNNGWILIGDEAGTFNAKRIYSRHYATVSSRPKLTVNYSAPPQPTPYEAWLNTYFYVGQFVDPAGDNDSDAIPNFNEFGFGTDPKVASPGPLQYTGTFAGGGAITSTGQPISMFEPVVDGIDFRALFVRRKDYVAAGLTYKPQFSANLTDWEDSAATPTVLADDGTYQVVSVPYPPFIGGEKARFFHVIVTMTP